MEQIKRRNSTADDKAKKKLIIESLSSLNKVIACFEDLSNEIIYEIFDCLDYCEVYDLFFNLNSRFRNLLLYLTVPIKINLSSVSRSDFQRYYNQLIIPNQQRIKSLHLSNLFIIERLFSPIPIFLQLTKLETLIINQIESIYIENLLDYLFNLPHLSSLVLISEDLIRNRNKLYNQIFRLCSLKYCKLSLKTIHQFELIPIATNEFSPIEHFVTRNMYSIDELTRILSYLPHLNRLSIYSSNKFYIQHLQRNLITSKYLTHVSFNDLDISFDEFKSIIHYYFHQIQVLHISIRTSHCKTYLSADQWQNLILYNMPHLRVFDIFFSYILYDLENIDNYICLINKFNCSFWSERQWFFRYHIYGSGHHTRLNMFSINPYRKKQYTLYEIEDKNTNFNTQKLIMNSVHRIEIRNKKTMNDCQIYFPNVNQLTIIENSFEQHTNLLSINLKNIIPLIQLTKFTYYSFKYDFSQIIAFIQYMPNIITFEIGCIYTVNSDLTSIQMSDMFQLISKTNNIRNMIIKYDFTLQEINLLIILCPRLQQISIKKSNNSFQTFLQLLLSNIHEKLKDLFLLCITHVSSQETENFKTFINSENLLYGYSIKHNEFKDKMYLWW